MPSKDVYPIMEKSGSHCARSRFPTLDFGQAAGGQTPAETEQATPSPTSGTAPIRLKPDAKRQAFSGADAAVVFALSPTKILRTTSGCAITRISSAM